MKEFLKSGIVGNIELDKSICTQTYQQAKENPVMKEKIKKILKRWTDLCFVENFPEERKEELAYSYEQLAIFLITCAAEETDALFTDQKEYFDTICFPMVRRVLGRLEPNEFNFQKFVDYCKIFNVNDIINETIKANGVIMNDKIDSEAEGVALTCDMIEEKFKNPDIDNDIIRKKWLNKLIKK